MRVCNPTLSCMQHFYLIYISQFSTRLPISPYRADLEAAAKAKTKLSAALSTLSADDARTISDLHTQLQDLEGVSAHLPAITSRLQDLSALHLQASTFATRLTSVENATREAERLLRGVEEAVSKVEDGWKANASAVESNVAALDERIKSLS